MSFMRSRTAVVVAGVGVVALVLGAGGTAVAAKLITSTDIKNHTIQQKDMASELRRRAAAAGQQRCAYRPDARGPGEVGCSGTEG